MREFDTFVAVLPRCYAHALAWASVRPALKTIVLNQASFALFCEANYVSGDFLTSLEGRFALQRKIAALAQEEQNLLAGSKIGKSWPDACAADWVELAALARAQCSVVQELLADSA